MKIAKKIIFVLFFSLLFILPQASQADCVDDGFCRTILQASNCAAPSGCAWVNLHCITSPACETRNQDACTGPRCSWSYYDVNISGDNTGGVQISGDNTDLGAKLSLDNPLGSVSSPQILIGKVINSVLGVVGSIALIMFIFGGLTWMTSGGNADKVKKGRDIIVWSAIGLVIIFASYGLVRFLILTIK